MLRQRDIYIPYFNPTEQALIYSALDDASNYLRDFYRFSPREWFNHCYYVVTERERGIPRPQAPAFAEVRQYRSVLKGASDFPQDRYQICLYDHNILNTLWRQSDLEFYPFMVYILTHELIHIARFSQDLHPFDCDPETLQKEEEKVNRLTQQVLKAPQSPSFCRISSLYKESHPCPCPPA